MNTVPRPELTDRIIQRPEHMRKTEFSEKVRNRPKTCTYFIYNVRYEIMYIEVCNIEVCIWPTIYIHVHAYISYTYDMY